MKKLVVFLFINLLLFVFPTLTYAKPILKTPLNGQVFDTVEVYFEWTDDAYSKSNSIKFVEFQYSNNYGFINAITLNSSQLNGYWHSHYFNTETRGQKMYWRVRDEYEIYENSKSTKVSEWSDVGSFYLDKLPTSITAGFIERKDKRITINGGLSYLGTNYWSSLLCENRFAQLKYFSNNIATNFANIEINNLCRYSFTFEPPTTAYYQVEFSGDDQHKPSISSPSVLISKYTKKKAVIKFSINPKKIVNGSDVFIKGELKDLSGNLLANRKIKIRANGKTIKQLITNSSGKFYFKHKPKKTTTYHAVFKQDSDYNASNSKTVKVIVKKAQKK